MRKIFVIIISLLVFSCGRMIDKPKNLLPKEKMAEIVADFAIYDQAYSVNPNANIELATRFVLKKHKIKAQEYNDSFKYYLSNPSDIDEIYEDAKEIILKKDPKLQGYIDKKKKENPNLPNFVK